MQAAIETLGIQDLKYPDDISITDEERNANDDDDDDDDNGDDDDSPKSCSSGHRYQAALQWPFLSSKWQNGTVATTRIHMITNFELPCSVPQAEVAMESSSLPLTSGRD